MPAVTPNQGTEALPRWDRLADGLRMPLVELPYVFAEQLGPPELERLADALEEGLP